MTLKNIKLARAENLPKEIRAEFCLPENGLVIVESHNPDLRDKYVAIKKGGIREYLLSLADFKDTPIEDVALS